MGLVHFFNDFPDGKVNKDLAVFKYKNKILKIKFGFLGVFSFLNNEWKKFFTDKILNDQIVIDLGCSIGDTSIDFIARGAKRVIGLEVLPYRYDLAIKNIFLNKFEEKCQIFNNVIGGRNGLIEVDFSCELSEHYNNLENHFKNKGASTAEVRVITLKNVLAFCGVQSRIIIKSDIQGGEYDVFTNTSSDILEMIDFIAIRYYYKKDNRAGILKKYFEEFGFKCKYYKPKRWGCGYLIAKNKCYN
jgi:FkbM family methyltransferase